METHVITCHGLTLTKDTKKRGDFDPNLPEEIILPSNVVVIANCYNRKTWISPMTMGVVWFFILHGIHKKIAEVPVSKEGRKTFFDLVNKYVRLLSAFSVADENKMCAYVNSSPNLSLKFPEDKFRTGVHTPPLCVKLVQKGGKRVSKRRIATKYGGNAANSQSTGHADCISKRKIGNYVRYYSVTEQYASATPEEREEWYEPEETQVLEEMKGLFLDPIHPFTRPLYNKTTMSNSYQYIVERTHQPDVMLYDHQTMNDESNHLAMTLLKEHGYTTLDKLISYNREYDPHFDKKFHVYVMNTCRTSKDKSIAEVVEQNHLKNEANVLMLKSKILKACGVLDSEDPDEIDFNTMLYSGYPYGNQEDMDSTCRVGDEESKNRVIAKMIQWYDAQLQPSVSTQVIVGGKNKTSKTKMSGNKKSVSKLKPTGSKPKSTPTQKSKQQSKGKTSSRAKTPVKQ